MSTVRITHIGGPTVLIEAEGWRLLTDPTFDEPGRRYAFGWGTSSRKLTGPAIGVEEIGPIDAVLLSHEQHDDNLDERAPTGDVGITGFEYSDVEVGPTAYRPGVAGSGPAVLLLHGFPQTHYCWHRVAPGLAERCRVVVCDLKGYGSSRSEPGGPLGEGYSKGEMAAELVELMARLGHDRFAVVGHDRGGRVAYRLALDHPDAVDGLGVLNIVPTVDQFERLAADAAIEYWPFIFLAQPPPFAERLVGPSAEYFVRHVLESWTATPGAITSDAIERYVGAFTPEVISRICAEYRAAFHIDRPIDADDRQAGRRITCPVLVHWGVKEDPSADGPLPIWRRWADDVRGTPGWPLRARGSAGRAPCLAPGLSRR